MLSLATTHSYCTSGSGSHASWASSHCSLTRGLEVSWDLGQPGLHRDSSHQGWGTALAASDCLASVDSALSGQHQHLGTCGAAPRMNALRPRALSRGQPCRSSLGLATENQGLFTTKPGCWLRLFGHRDRGSSR